MPAPGARFADYGYTDQPPTAADRPVADHPAAGSLPGCWHGETLPWQNGAIMAAKRTAADRQRAAEIRAWAAGHGLTVAESGRIPQAVVLAYDQRAQNGGPGPPADDAGSADDAPDWGAAGIDALDLDEPQEPPPGNWAPEDWDQDGAGVERSAAPAGPPPPASLQDARDLLAPPGKAVPPWAGNRGSGGRSDQRPPSSAAAPPRLTRAQLGEIQGNWALLLSLPATGLAMIDPACGGAAADNIDTIISKSMPLVIKSPRAVQFLSEAGDWLAWYGLGAAMLPVIQMAWSHHVTHSVMVLDGQVVASKRLPDGQVVPVQPQAQQQQDWSAYGTEVPGHVPPVRV